MLHHNNLSDGEISELVEAMKTQRSSRKNLSDTVCYDKFRQFIKFAGVQRKKPTDTKKIIETRTKGAEPAWDINYAPAPASAHVQIVICPSSPVQTFAIAAEMCLKGN